MLLKLAMLPSWGPCAYTLQKRTNPSDVPKTNQCRPSQLPTNLMSIVTALVPADLNAHPPSKVAPQTWMSTLGGPHAHLNVSICSRDPPHTMTSAPCRGFPRPIPAEVPCRLRCQPPQRSPAGSDVRPRGGRPQTSMSALAEVPRSLRFISFIP